MAEANGTKERKTRIGATVGEIADSAEQITDSAVSISKMPSQQAITLLAVGSITFLCIFLGFQSWRESEDRKAAINSMKDQMNAQMRENNSQLELKSLHCQQEAEKARADSKELVKTVMTAFIEEGSKNRTFQAEQNEKLRTELISTLRMKSIGP